MFFKKKKLTESDFQAVKDSASKRPIEIHSVNPINAATGSPAEGKPDYYRIAFSVTDPPGPYSLQFLEALPEFSPAIEKLEPLGKATYYESRDEARVRVIETEEGDLILPR